MLQSALLEALLASPVTVIIDVALLWTRSVMFLGVAQVFGLVGSSRALRLAVSLVLAVFLAPINFPLTGAGRAEVSQWLIAVFLVKEVVLGFTLGALVNVPIWIVEGVGAMFDNQRGAMTGQTFNPMLSSPSPMALLLQHAGVLVVLSHGGLGWICELFATMARVWPPSALLPAGGLPFSDAAGEVFSTLTRGMLLYFAPLLGVMMLVEVAIALMSVYAPQLQAFTLAMPAKTLVGLLLLVLVMNLMLDAWWSQTSSYLSALLQAVQERAHGR